MQELSDESLMHRIAGGDREAFRILVRRHSAPAAGFARRMVGGEADAEEVVQEALLRVWVNAPRWRPLASFRTWFYRIVLNLCLSRRRKPVPLSLDAAEDVADTALGPAEHFEREERDRRIAEAIAALPERQRAAIVLTYREGLSNAEVAAIVDTSVSGVETLLVRARRTLRSKLGSDVSEGNED
ncbi:MAG: sigma-70 family RNA polymerase sigma factor [Rhizobiales bacterium]|jgi:RNA polymerase sigma-70 factor (ECF subfamily)|nr:sigma-70 family RNA polymerase sigma factor [Hyphomicrobiales bacterium]